MTTGYSREYVLYRMTFADVIAGARYAVRYAEYNAQLHAVNVGRLFTRQSPTEKRPFDRASIHSPERHLNCHTGSGNGILELQRNNIGY